MYLDAALVPSDGVDDIFQRCAERGVHLGEEERLEVHRDVSRLENI